MLTKFRNSKGQAVLLVLLGMAAVLTLALSIVSRTVSDISNVTSDEKSSQAYTKAEEGIEALLYNPYTNGGVYTSTNVSASATRYGENQSQVEYDPIKAGQSDTIWFVSHHQSGYFTCSGGVPCYTGNSALEMQVCWGDDGTANNQQTTPAIEVSVYYDDTRASIGSSPNYSGVKVVRRAFDGYSARATLNGFQNVASNTCTGLTGYRFSSGTIRLSDYGVPNGATCLSNAGGCLLFARIKLLYSDSEDHKIGVTFSGGSGNASIPQQGWLITSTGTVENAKRRIETIQYLDEPLDIFDNAINSYGSQASLYKP